MLSQCIYDLLLSCLSIDAPNSNSFTVAHCLIRGLSRDSKFEMGLPLIPAHAVQMLDWLRDHHYQNGGIFVNDCRKVVFY